MKILMLMSFLFLISCGHHRDVRPGANGVHRVVISTPDTQEGQQNALRQANHYCKQYEKHAAIYKESAKYTGSLDEKTYNTTRMFSRAAKTAGSPSYGNGGRKQSKLAGYGSSLDSALGNGYVVEMSFKCI